MAKKGIFWDLTQSFFDLDKNFILIKPLKLAKIIGVF